MTKKNLFLAALLAAIANFFWAANAIVGKVVVAELPAFSLSQFRWLLALLILLPIGLPKIVRQWPWYRANFQRLFWLSLLSVAFYNTFQYWSLEYTQPVNVGAMLALMPLAISIASSFTGGRKQSRWEWLLVVAAVLGALTVITKGQLLILFGESGLGYGELLMVLAIVSWAAYSVLLKATPHSEVDMLGLLAFFVGLGTLLILPFWLFDIATQPVFIPSGSLWWSVLFVATFPSIVSYLCWNTAIRIGDATIAGLMVTTAPLFNAMLSIVFLDQTISSAQWLGVGIVIVSVAAALVVSKYSMSGRATTVPIDR